MVGCITAALTEGDTTILGKAFGTLSHLPMICGLSNNLPSPPPFSLDSDGCYTSKTFGNLSKCLDFNFVWRETEPS